MDDVAIEANLDGRVGKATTSGAEGQGFEKGKKGSITGEKKKSSPLLNHTTKSSSDSSERIVLGVTVT